MQHFQRYLTRVKDFVPPTDSGLSSVNILLAGAVGSGKSSFASSLDSIFLGYISRWRLLFGRLWIACRDLQALIGFRCCA